MRLSKKEELLNAIGKYKWTVFGAGNCAKYILSYLKTFGFDTDCVYVSDTKGNSNELLAITVDKWEGKYADNYDCIIIAVKEQLQNDILNMNHFPENIKVYLSTDELFYELGYEYEVEHRCRNESTSDNTTCLMAENLTRFIPKPCMDYMVLNILDHCNLRCKGCDHFACIADRYFVSKDTIHKDLDRMAELLDGDYLTKIGVMGGEPLLHPDLLDILTDVRVHFPYSIIRLTTNGLLLGQQDDKFWKILRENDISIVNTKYPLKIDHNGLRKRADAEGIKFMHFEGTDEGKKLFKKKINLDGTSNPVKSFASCHISNYGNFLMEGKLYGCPFSCQSNRIFNKRFNQNLRMTDNDYLDIYKIKDKQEIFDFAARPKYYCRYCMGLSETFEWEHTQQKIEEWV